MLATLDAASAAGAASRKICQHFSTMEGSGLYPYVAAGHAGGLEWQARRQRIDPRLRALGWDVVRWDPHHPLADYTRHAVAEYPTDNGPADYALFVDGRILGIVEAKRLSLGPQNVL